MTEHHLLDRLRAWSALLPLLLLLAGTYWLSEQVLPLPPVPNYKARHDPDFIISNFAAVDLGESGAPRFLIAAQKMEHYPDDDSTELTEPRLTSPSAGNPPIHISALRGTISQNGEDVYLNDDVRVVKLRGQVRGDYAPARP